MKKLFLLSCVCLALTISTTSYAQLTKAEKKEWKKKAKEYKKNPAALKQVADDNSVLNSQIGTLKSDNEALKASVSDKNAKIDDLNSQLQKLRSDLAAARKQASDLQSQLTAKPQMESSGGGKMVDGVVFKVQIGAFRNKDLSKYFENHENFGGEATDDGTQKITLGQFRDYWEADTFKKYLREMGVKDAWIVPYKDGTRVDIKDVLEGVVQEGAKTGE